MGGEEGKMARRGDFEGLGNRTKTILHNCIFYTVNPLCTNYTFCSYNSNAEKQMLQPLGGLIRAECTIKLIYCDLTLLPFLK